ncbi:hypothetical protein H0W91_02030 [Patescibacteria group bacterium]|nr:hypothetical protein [Patescibacteria group bacterium]
MDSDKKTNLEIAPKTLDPVSYFEQDGDFVVAFKKTEKLASAVYIVTNLLSDNEPMKWTLRKKVSEFLSFSLSYKDVSDSAKNSFVYSAKSFVLEIVSLLEVSMRGGLISTMNFGILKQEFNNLISIYSSSESHDSKGNIISENFFDVVRPNTPSESRYIGSTPTSLSVQNRVPEYTQKSVNNPQIKDKEDEKKSLRQTTILALLRRKKELTIKDIASVIKDCSEKTVQRELNTFIANGVLKRSGVRRWSKYSLNN